MTNNVRDIYKALPDADLHKIRALIRQGVAFDIVSQRAGLALPIIEYAAARVRRSERRLKKRSAPSSPSHTEIS